MFYCMFYFTCDRSLTLENLSPLNKILCVCLTPTCQDMNHKKYTSQTNLLLVLKDFVSEEQKTLGLGAGITSRLFKTVKDGDVVW